VLLISDGWDCGDVDLLYTEIARLQLRHRLIGSIHCLAPTSTNR
jgi:uncharacterized protein with von Willebrand factor type A (vWA) domain